MPEEEHLSSLERVRRRLYSTQAPTDTLLTGYTKKPSEQTRGWDTLKVAQAVIQTETQHMSGPARFFISALGFFLVTLIATGAYLYFGGRSISTNNLIITTQGPTTIASGDTVPLLLSLDNKNPTTLRDVTVTITYPEGTRSSEDATKPLSNYVENLGDIPPGGHVERTIRASVFGSEGAQISLPIKVQFKTDGSNSTFAKQKQYEFAVTSSPIALTISSLAQVSSGQSLSVDVQVKNNATTALENIAVVAEYPFGFAVSSTDPKPTTGSLFYIGTLASGEQKTIHITGVVTGENQDDRIFKFNGGTVTSPSATTLATSYSAKEVGIKVTKPFLSTSLTINHDSSETPTITPGTTVIGTVTWLNNLASQVTNGEVHIQLTGEALDPASVQAGNGFYRSSDSTILYTYQTSPSLGNLAPGASGQGTFTFSTKKPALLASLRSPAITMKVSISGQRVNENNVPEQVTSTLTRVVRIGTNLNLTSRAVRTIGGISNTGPWPPVENQETTYTIQYTLNNNLSSVGGTKVTASLPSYVRYTGKVSPNDGTLTYDESNRTVTWNIGDVDAGGTAKTMSFQVGLTPSISQSGTYPVLVGAQSVTGTDRFTQKPIQGTVGEITTQTTSDPAYTDAKGKVK